jgi:hypothetical protein
MLFRLLRCLFIFDWIRFDTVEVRSSSLLVPTIFSIGIRRIPEILSLLLKPLRAASVAVAKN